jgi:hypothetical protein
MTSDADAPTAARPAGPRINYVELTFALMGGPFVWLLRLVVNSSLVDYSCRIGATWPLWLTTAIATVVSAVALAASFKYYRMPGDATTARWLGLLAIMFNVLAIIGIVFETAPAAVLDVCQEVRPP